MAKIKLHPLFLAFGVVLIFLGKGSVFLWTLFALFFHETAHMLAAKSRGYLLGELTLMPYGACLWGEEKMDKRSMAYIAVAGPLANLILIFVVMAIWWAFPHTEKILKSFFWANVSLVVFNLLPAFPLDGSRVVLAVVKNRLKALKILKGVGITLSFALFALFLISAFFDINYSLGIIAVFLFAGAVYGSKKEAYCHVFSNRQKDYFNELRGYQGRVILILVSFTAIGILLMLYFLRRNYSQVAKLLDRLDIKSSQNGADNEFQLIDGYFHKMQQNLKETGSRLQRQNLIFQKEYLEKLLRGNLPENADYVEEMCGIRWCGEQFTTLLF